MAASERWNRSSWQRLTASSSSFVGRSLQPSEQPEVVNLRRLIAVQNATLDEQRRRIAATEQQIEEYERCIHNDRCLQDGYDYLQRAYNLLSSYDEEEDFESRCRKSVTEDAIAVYYRQASDEIRRRLIRVETQLVEIASNCRMIAECDVGKQSEIVDEFEQSARSDVDGKAQSVVDGNALRQRSFQLDALRWELARTDDVHRRQLVEQRRLSSAIRDAQLQLDDEETRLTAMIATSSYDSADIQKSCRPPKTKKLQTAEMIEKDRQITAGRFDPDGQVSVSDATHSASLPDRSAAPRKDRNYGSYNIAIKSRDIYSRADIFSPDSASEDAGCCSLPDDDDLFIDCHRLVTLV